MTTDKQREAFIAREASIWMHDCDMDLCTTAAVLAVSLQYLAEIIARDPDRYRPTPFKSSLPAAALPTKRRHRSLFRAASRTPTAWLPNGQPVTFNHRRR